MHQRKAEDASSAQELLQQAVEEMDSLVNAAESFSAEPIDNAIAALEGLVSDIDALPQQPANAENTAISASDSNETVAGDSLTATDIHGVDAYKNTAGYGPWLKKENDETVKHDENLASSDGLVLDERTARAIRLAAETDEEKYQERALEKDNALKNTYNYIDLVIKNIQRIPAGQRTPAQNELIDKFKSPEAVRLFNKILTTPEDKTSDSSDQEIIPEDKYAELARNVNRMRYISEWKMSPEQLKEKEQYIAQWNKLVSQGRIKQPEKLLAENLYVPDEAAADDDGNNVAKTWLRKVDVSRVIDSSPTMQNIVSDSIAELTNYLRKNYIHQSKSAASASLNRTLSADDKQTPESYSIEIKKYLKKAVSEFIDAKTHELGRAIFFQEYLQLVRAAFAGTTSTKDFIETIADASGSITLDERLKPLLEDQEFIANIEKMIVSEVGAGAFDENSGPLAGFSIQSYPENTDTYGAIWYESVNKLEAIPVYKTKSGVDVVSPEGNDDIAQYYKNIEYAKERIEEARDNALAPIKTFTDSVAQWNTKFQGLEKELTDAGSVLQNFAGDKALRLAFFSPGIHRPLVDAARAELENAIKLLKQGYQVATVLTGAIKESSKRVPSLQELVAGSMLSESDKISNIEDMIAYVAKDTKGKLEIPLPYDADAKTKTFDVSKESNTTLSEFINKKVALLSAASRKLSDEVNKWLSVNSEEIESRVKELRPIIDNIHTSTASIESIYKKITQSAPVTDMVLRARSAASGLLYKIMQKNRQPGAASVIAAIQDTKDELHHYISSRERELKKKEKLITQQKDSYTEYSESLAAITKTLDEYNKRNDTLQQDELAQFIEETKDTYQDPAVAKKEFYKKKYDEYALLEEDVAAAQKNLDYVQNKMLYLDNSIALLLENSSDAKNALATLTNKTAKYVAIYNQLVEIFGGEQFSVPQEKLLNASPEYAEAAEVLYQLERALIAIKTDAENYEDDTAALKQLDEKKEQLLAHIQSLKPIYSDLQQNAREQVLGGQENFEQSEELLAELRKEDSVVRDAIESAIAVIESPSNEYIPTADEEESAEAAQRSEDDAADAAREDAASRTDDDNSETDGSIESSASATHKSRCHMRSAKDNIWLSVNASLPITPTLKEIQKLIELAKDMIFPSIDGHAIAMVLSNHGAFQQDTSLTSFLVNDTLSALDNAGITVTNRNVLEQALWYGEGAND